MLTAGVVVFLFLFAWAPQNVRPNPVDADGKLEGGPDPANVCTTVGCVEAAHYIVEMVNQTADPCDNFYKFACGTFIDNTFATVGSWKKPHDEFYKSLVGKAEFEFLTTPEEQLSPAEMKARRYYKSCEAESDISDEASTDFLREFAKKKLGHFAVTKVLDVPNNWTLETLLAKTINHEGTAFFKLQVQPDSRNSSRYGLFLEPTLTPVFDHKESLAGAMAEPDYFEDLKESYFKYFKEFFSKFLLSRVKVNMRDKYLRRLIQFEIELAKIVPPWTAEQETPEDDVSYQNFKNTEEDKFSMSITELEEIAPKFNWRKFFQETGRLYKVEAFKKVDDLRISVRNVTYFKNWSNLLQRTMNKTEQLGKERTLNNYVGFRIISDYLSMLSCQYKLPFSNIIDKAKRKEVFKTEENCDLDEAENVPCDSQLKTLFTHLVARRFVSKHFKKENVDHLVEIAEILRSGFAEELTSVSWMDEETRMAAIKKAKNMLFAIGYPANLFDPEFEHQFDSLDISDKYLSNQMSFHRFNKIQELRMLDGAVDRYRYFWDGTDPLEQNAFYQPRCNMFGLMAGDNIAPAYQIAYPAAFNWGRAASTIGHEITHGFDNKGKDFNEIGQYQNWWTEASLEGFNNRVACLIEQFNKFEPERENYGEQVLPDSIADNGGVKLAHKMFRKTFGDEYLDRVELPGLPYSNDQVFFMSQSFQFCYYYDEDGRTTLIADEHALPEYRINGMMQNSEPWIDAFKCPVGSKMNPVGHSKCSIW